MIRERQSAQWSEWLTEAANPAAPVDIRRFANSLKADEAAVKAALSLLWSNGQLDGQINRLKTAKAANVRSGQLCFAPTTVPTRRMIHQKCGRTRLGAN